MLTRTLSRLLISAALVLTYAVSANTGGGATASTPAIPLISYHYHFDHHWYVWLPRHPTYEAVEVMSIDSPVNPYKLVWVFFTEREGAKRQHHFMDNPWIAEGTDYFHFRDIDYRRTGEADEGQGVHVSFIGPDGAPIEISIDAEGAPLGVAGAGLTNQSGHGAERVVMLFHRKRSARTGHNTVLIDGRDFSFLAGDDPEETHRFVAAYAADIQIAVFPFGEWGFTAGEAHLSDNAAGLSFAAEARDGGLTLAADLPGYDDRITIELDGNGALERYRHDVGGHRLVISLDEPLPLTGPAPQSASRFSVLMDPDEPVAGGRVVSEPTESGRRLSWTIDTPSWAAGYPFESLVERQDGGLMLTISSTRQSD